MTEWTEKYRPESLSDVRGNNKSVEELEEWAEGWSEHREPALVYGAPGVGKTSAVHALAADRDWRVVEQNASDSRTADAVEKVAGEAARSQGLGGGRTLVVLDEADNLHGNADRGGSSTVTEIAKEAEQPMVLIANEEREMSGAVKRACQKIEFADVTKRSIVPVLRDLLQEEGVEYESEALDEIAEANSGDLRGAVNDLQAVAEGRSKLTVEDVEVTGGRDREEEIWGFLDTLFKGDDMEKALREVMDVDESPDDLVHWIDEGMPKVYSGAELVDGYHWLSRADVYLGRTIATQNYSLWRYANSCMVGGVHSARQESKGGWTRYGFPTTWRKLGQTKKSRGLRDSAARKVGESSLMSMAAARDLAFPYIELLMEDETQARRIADGLDLTAEEVAELTGMDEDEASELVEEDVQEVDEDEWEGFVDDRDEDDQSTLGSFD